MPPPTDISPSPKAGFRFFIGNPHSLRTHLMTYLRRARVITKIFVGRNVRMAERNLYLAQLLSTYFKT
jgi:hypothetical protein